MATSKQINFFNELIAQGREGGTYTRQVQGNPESADVKTMWYAIGELLGSEGNGSVKMDENYNQEMVDTYNREKENGFKKKETRLDSENQKDEVAGFDLEYLKEQATQENYDLYTNNYEEAMWIAPSGRLINGNFDGGFRNLDHRNALKDDSSNGIRNAVENGAVRVIPEYQTVQTIDGSLDKLSPEVKKQVEHYINKLGWDIEEVDV